MIPAPANVHYEKSTRRASSTVDDTPLHLTAKIELENDDGTWRWEIMLLPAIYRSKKYELSGQPKVKQ